MLFQFMAGTESLNVHVENLLATTVKRMKDDPTPIELKKLLLGNFMASMYYNAPLTLTFLEQNQMTS